MRAVAEQTVLVTGATDGIGHEVARELLEQGATVLLHGRSHARAQAAGERLAGDGAAGGWEVAVADLASLEQVRALAADVSHRHPRLDAVVNNAGIGYGTAPARGAHTEDGHEPTWQVNLLAPFLLTLLLRDTLAAAGGARVVNVSSGVQASGAVDLEQPDEPRSASPYTQSKIALIMFTLEPAERWRETGIDVNACDPGWIATKMGGGGGGALADGADTPLWLVTEPSLAGSTGGYFARRRRQAPNPQAEDAADRRRLWELVATQVGLDAPG